jgi:transcriptional regulator NrdR family protein
MTDVVKRDGTRQPFSEAKVRMSIEAAAKEARVPDQRRRRVVDDSTRELLASAKGQKLIESRIIREKILGELDSREPSVSAAWRAFDAKKG